MPRGPPVRNGTPPTEFTAATQALKQANEAVTGRDYRLALNYALESREQAQNAARTAADSRAKLRGDVERSIAESKALMAQTRARVDGPAGAQIPRGTRRTAQQRLKQLEGDLQKADAALQAEEYMEAERLLMGDQAADRGALRRRSHVGQRRSLRNGAGETSTRKMLFGLQAGYGLRLQSGRPKGLLASDPPE